MKNNVLKKFVEKLIFYFVGYTKKSWSQCGEDLICDFIFRHCNKDKITYLDIGANHPKHINNTWLFYKKGNRGVLIEPDPDLYNVLINTRSKDTCLNCGVCGNNENKKGELDFYVLSVNTLNTFSKDSALNSCEQGNAKILKTLKIPVFPINEIMEKHFKDKGPDLISIDTEGLEMEILKNLDFEKYRPGVMIIETLTYSESKKEQKIDNIIDYVKSMGYMVYADTYINTIFVEKGFWNKDLSN